jgi:hypothetical protein
MQLLSTDNATTHVTENHAALARLHGMELSQHFMFPVLTVQIIGERVK